MAPLADELSRALLEERRGSVLVNCRSGGALHTLLAALHETGRQLRQRGHSGVAVRLLPFVASLKRNDDKSCKYFYNVVVARTPASASAGSNGSASSDSAPASAQPCVSSRGKKPDASGAAGSQNAPRTNEVLAVQGDEPAESGAANGNSATFAALVGASQGKAPAVSPIIANTIGAALSTRAEATDEAARMLWQSAPDLPVLEAYDVTDHWQLCAAMQVIYDTCLFRSIPAFLPISSVDACLYFECCWNSMRSTHQPSSCPREHSN